MGKFPFDPVTKEPGQKLLEQGDVRTVVFSEGTYQVEVIDDEEFWPFLQIDDRAHLRDCFCTCDEAEKSKSCRHLAAAFLRIVGERQPVHVRFRDSLWNHLGKIFLGEEAVWSEENGSYVAKNGSNEEIFTIKGNDPAVKEILFNRVEETEETSLKFSNLSEEDIEAWHAGRPSEWLTYELSIWSDLAKHLFLLQESDPNFTVEYEQDGDLPTHLVMNLKTCTIKCHIRIDQWKDLVPALATLKSTIPICAFSSVKIEKIVYNRLSHAMNVVANTSPEIESTSNVIDLGKYCFSKEQGFFPKETDPILTKNALTAHDIKRILQKYPRFLERYIENERIHYRERQLSYNLYFDAKADFHIAAYLFEPGDLQKQESAQYGRWVYVDGRGFYPIEVPPFHDLHKVVKKNEMGDFISRHKVWLNHYEGFRTHVASIDSHLTYIVDEKGLTFSAQTELVEEAEGEMIDLKEWVYMKGRGFYARTAGRNHVALRPGLTVPREEISDFIDSARDDLENVSGFFSDKQPIISGGLDVTIGDSGKIHVEPHYGIQVGYKPNTVEILKRYTYVSGEGFRPIPDEYRAPDQYTLPIEIEKRKESSFIHYDLPTLMPYIHKIDNQLRPPEHLKIKVVKVKKGAHGRIVTTLQYHSEFGSVEIGDVWSGIHTKQLYLISPAGLIYYNQSRFNWLKGIDTSSIHGSEIELTTLEWIRLSILETVKLPTDDPASMAILEEMSEFSSDDHLDHSTLKSDLRPYQDHGVRWLWFLYRHGLSGLLCDEMGLGKTHQAMALLSAVTSQNLPASKKILIVCPTSVIYHWESLLHRFLPDVSVRVFYGLNRSLKGFTRSREVLLTSYGTLRSEKKNLSEFNYELVIFDEIQVAKNAFSQTHRALRSLTARMKLGLTGTPIENRLFELKSLFDIILPGYFPSDTQYKELFVNPIEKRGDVEKRSLLSQLVKPFVLRRKKDEVLDDLPEKIEEISVCELLTEQKNLYRAAFQKERDHLLTAIEDESQPIPYVHIFSLFNKLKQICDHPALVKKTTADFNKHKSGKWELFTELLQEAQDSEQKVVVFTQYLGMLDIMKAYLREQKIGFAEIRGSTKGRREQMEKFRDDPECRIFLGSLQAAGVGIDLVSASVVIHYDRWWNPAKENQATDRVHRIGQSRGVQVFKLVTKDTIEEHIHALIEKKLTLLSDIVSYDDHNQLKHLNRDELAAILTHLDSHLP